MMVRCPFLPRSFDLLSLRLRILGNESRPAGPATRDSDPRLEVLQHRTGGLLCSSHRLATSTLIAPCKN
jgi:hypothetical protein